MKTETAQPATQYPISVIIPCYNAAQTLGDCLAGLRENDLTGVELVVVDDASTDSTRELIESLNSSFELDLRYIRLPQRGGPGAARNAGLDASSHPFLFFLDADIVLPARSIDFIRETLDLYSHRNRVSGVLGTYAEETPVDDFFTTFKNLYTCYLYRMTETLSPFIHTAMFVVRKDVLEKEGAFDSAMVRAEDFKLGAILGSKGYRFVIDWRIEGVHLKTYTLKGILREDWHRIRELKKIKLTEEQKSFSYRAHRWSRILSLVLPGITLLLAALAVFWLPGLWLAGAALSMFILVNSGFFFYSRKRRGTKFAFSAIAFLFLEMLWATAALLLSSRR